MQIENFYNLKIVQEETEKRKTFIEVSKKNGHKWAIVKVVEKVAYNSSSSDVSKEKLFIDGEKCNINGIDKDVISFNMNNSGEIEIHFLGPKNEKYISVDEIKSIHINSEIRLGKLLKKIKAISQ